MRIKSPLSNLRDVLSIVQTSANNYKPTLISNEAATRAVLIDPVLRELGWDTANTYMVEVEKTLNHSQADYALYDDGGTVRIIIEAKKLGDNLGQHDIKLVQYAFTFKLASIFLTDGIVWRHYTNFNPAQFIPTKVLNIQQDDLGEIAAYLVQHLDAARFWPDDQSVDLLAQQVGQLQSDLATLQQQMATLTTPSVAQPATAQPLVVNAKTTPGTASQPGTTPTGTFVPLHQLTDVTRTRPSVLRLPDGSELSVNSWADVLVEACKFSLLHHPNLTIPLKDKSGQKVNLFDVVEPPPNIGHIKASYAGKVVYVYTNYSANNKAVNALYVLQQLPNQMQKVVPSVVYG